MDARETFTSRGTLGLVPWNGSENAYCISQLYLGYNPISILEVVSTLNINNMSRSFLHYYDINRTKKYNPKVYIGSQNSVSEYWQLDHQNGKDTTISFWPESFVKNITLLRPYKNSNLW